MFHTAFNDLFEQVINAEFNTVDQVQDKILDAIDSDNNAPSSTVPVIAMLDQSVSTGTLLTEDLYASFMPVLKALSLKDYVAMLEYWQSLGSDLDDESQFIAELFDVIDSYSPDGYYFGSHIGDGSDFGFWKSEDFWNTED